MMTPQEEKDIRVALTSAQVTYRRWYNHEGVTKEYLEEVENGAVAIIVKKLDERGAEITRLTEENARLRKAIDKLEEESNDHYEDYKAAKARLDALASYLKLVKVSIEYSVASKWKKNSLKAALSHLVSGAKDRIKPLWEVSVNDTFREAWAILQYWDFDLDPDPKVLKDIKTKYSPKKDTEVKL